MRLTAILFLISIACFAQKKEAKKDSVQYHKFVKIDIEDYQKLLNAADQYKRLAMYDPSIPDQSKSAVFRNIEANLIELYKRVSIDSVKIKK